LTDGLNVTEPGPNKDLPPRCGIDVMLVLDESGSIEDADATDAVRNATRAFLDALSGTGASVSIIDFSTTAKQQVDYTTVTSESITNTFNPYIDNEIPGGYNPSGWTNWEDAFDKVHQANATGGTLADLVVFITDGDPTARNTDNGPKTGITAGAVEALQPAWEEANRVKLQGSHVFALGVGSAVTKPTSARRLTAVSGFDQFPQKAFEVADYTLVEDFDDLAAALRQIAIALCRASVTITKLVDEDPVEGAGHDEYVEAAGWKFTATVSTSEGGFDWVQPPPATPDDPRSQTTDDDGVATFQWKPGNAQATSTVTISEEVKPGYQFVDYTCEVNAPGRTRKRTRQGSGGAPVGTGQLRPNEYARCTVRNRRAPLESATIRIIKDAVPNDSHVFNFTGGLGEFALSDDDVPEPPTFKDFTVPPGTYVVRETPQDSRLRLAPRATWTLVGITCSNPAFPVDGPQVAITVGPGEGVSCTFQNKRGDEPPPEPPDPPPPPPDPPPPVPPQPPVTPQPPTPPPSTQLEVEKTAPRVARVGQRVPFRLTVTNVGTVAATNVRLADVPPAALTLASLKGTTARVVRGNAIWRLGTLAPGEKRTVRGSVRIKAGTPGLKRNLVLATAVNAQLVSDRADTRLLGQGVRGQRRVSPVTG
jgi:uncharacterized repeat protein (TIGR01451 family)